MGKLLISEHTKILNAIQSLGLDIEEFSFTKKSGWVTIHYKQRDLKFTFIRKKKSEIDDNGKFMDRVFYKVKDKSTLKKNAELSLAELLENISKWLSPFQEL